jgi:methylated-DNA-[protein]-cysteine S-methyltransferase
LAKNPFPIIIPCHRVIRTDGSIGGYQGGVEMKRALLEMEGIAFDAKGRAVVKGFFEAR